MILYCTVLTMLGYGDHELQNKNALLGSVVHSISFGEIELIENGMIVYANNGIIEKVFDLDKVTVSRTALRQRFRSVVDYTGKLIMPGFVDAHCHAPQYVFSGTGMDLPLLAWLEKYTFPCEARFADVTFARNAYEKSIRRHLKCGTTFASYFATIHNSGGKVLVDVINQVGQRAFVGKVSMDRNSPDFYIEETERGCQDAEEFARYVLSMTAVGSTFLNAVDTNAPLSTAALLTRSRAAAAAAAQTTRARSTSFGGVISRSVSLQGGDAVGNGNSHGNAGVHGVNSNGFSGSKRPRSVSMGDDEALGRVSPRMVSLSGRNFTPPETAMHAAPLSGASASAGAGAAEGMESPRVTFAPDASTNDGATSSSSSSGTLSHSNSDRILNGHPETGPSAGSSSSAIRPSAPVFLSAMYRPRAISDMDNYGFEDDEYYLSGRIMASHSQGHSTLGGDVVTTLLNRPFTPLVMPTVTPRFVPTCTPEMMASLGALAGRYGLPVQSHLSESVSEIAWVKDLHPECENYAAVYQKYGLLNEYCVMAHCCHSNTAERRLLAQCGTAMVHCASSNFSLDSGVLNVHKCIEEGLKVGLGTDVAGGYSPSMLDAIRQSIVASKVVLFDARGDLVPDRAAPTAPSIAAAAAEPTDGLTSGETTTTDGADAQGTQGSILPTTATVTTTTETTHGDLATAATDALNAAQATTALQLEQAVAVPTAAPRKPRTLSYKEAFHLATVGGAQALGMGDVIGNFLPGRKLDCLVVDPAVPQGPFDCFDGEGPLEWFQKFLFLGDDRNIVSVYVDGRQVI